MSDSEQKGQCRSEVDECRGSPSELKIADAIDRLAADVAAVKEAVCGNRITAEETKKIQSDMEWVNKHEQWRREERDAARLERDAAIRERDQWREEARLAVINRDEARAEVERLRAELAARPAANSPEIPDSSPAAPQPAAPPPWWLTEEERRVLQNHAESLREQRFALERGGQAIGYSVNPGLLKREADLIDAILSRAGSPPVVEVPAISRRDVPMQNEAFAYRDAMDKAGVKWKEKEVGRE